MFPLILCCGVLVLVPVRGEDPFESLLSPPILLLKETLRHLLDLESVSDQCRKDTRLVMEGSEREEKWALKYLDAMGKVGSGVMESGLDFPGFALECMSIDAQDFPKGNYCFVKFSFSGNNSTNLTWSLYPRMGLGFCIPDTCSGEDLQEASQTAAKPFVVTRVQISECSRNPTGLPTDPMFWVMIGIVLWFVLMAILGTTYDLVRKSPDVASSPSVVCNTASSEALCKGPRKTPAIELLRSFSIYRNSSRITSTGETAGILASLHGLRFLTMVCIIACHSFTFAREWIIFRNLNSMLGNASELSQIINNATFAVDTFFFLSGFLASLSMFKVLEKNGGHLTVLSVYIHRYIRMTPSMMIIIGLCATCLRYMGSGPKWEDASTMYDSWCRENWWANALYIQNFYRREHMCLSHSWYSAVDMQFFILVPFITYICYKSAIGAVFILLVPLATTTIYPIVLTFIRDLPAVLNEDVSRNAVDEYYALYYIKPYCRMGPYMIGIILAYVITIHNKSIKISKMRFRLGWLLVILLNAAVIITMNTGHGSTVLKAAFYNGFARTLWALILAWFTLTCHSGNAGFLNKLLSLRVFVPLSRLTYNAYLVHPVLMALFYGTRDDVHSYSFYSMIYLISGNLFITYFASYALALLFEIPIATFEGAVRQRLT